MKKKIIFFHPYSVLGGADLSISKLIDSISKEYELEFLTISKQPKINFYSRKNIKIYKIKKKRLLHSVIYLREKFIKDSRSYDKIILISNQYFANIISILSTFNLPKIKTILFERNHLSELSFSESNLRYIKNKILLLSIKYFYKFADRIVGNSFQLSKDLSKFTGRKVKTIRNFYDFNKILIKSKKKKIKKIRFKKNIVINVGRMEHQKNQILILKTFRILNKKNDNINLILIGDGSKKKGLEHYIKKNKLNKNVQIISGVTNALPYLKRANLYICTSHYEGFSNVLVEAITVNLPIISTYFKSGLSELLLNGKGGTIINNSSPESIAKKIKFFFDNQKIFNKKAKEAKKKITELNYFQGQLKFKKLINSL